MIDDGLITRRSVLLGAAGLIGSSAADLIVAKAPAAAGELPLGDARVPLWRIARRRGLVFGSSAATWQLADAQYRELFAAEAGILFTEDDLLWYRLRPTPESELDFTYGDRIVAFAERQGMPVFGAHLVWDQGFGEGWTDDDLWGLDEPDARRLVLRTVRRTVEHYRGRVAA